MEKVINGRRGLPALGLSCLEVVLDKRQEEDWFASRFIVALPLLLLMRRSVAVE